MAILEDEKALLEQWIKSAEGKKMQQYFDLAQADDLKAILKNSPDPGTLLEMVYDLLSSEKRKLEGSFFTPRYVADFMVRNALELYLSSHRSYAELCAVKILDPACGAGEFLLSALDILLEKRRSFEPDVPINELTKSIIKNNLYGIDCNNNSLQLLLERLKALSGGEVDLEHFVNKDVLDYYPASSCFNDNIKFDLVIGNPPYVSFGLRNVKKLQKDRADELKKRFVNSAEYKINIYALFMESALDSTAENGVNSFIVPDSFLCGQYFGKIRNFLLEHSAFESIMFIRKKIFRAVPGSLVIYNICKSPIKADHKFKSLIVEENAPFPGSGNGYLMKQSEFKNNFRQRFRLFFDPETHNFVRRIEEESVCKLGDLVTLASGLIARHGKNSIISDVPRSDGDFRSGIISGRSVVAGKILYGDCKYINCDPSAIKSGLGKVDYSQKKLLIRQTGDRIISAVDDRGLLVLNNLHIATAKNPSLDLERLSAYLNSSTMLKYYQSVTLEAHRAMAQIDLETLRELPMPEDFSGLSGQ